MAVPESHVGALSGTAAHLLEGSQAQPPQASRPGSSSGWKTGKGTNRSHRAPPQASPHQGSRPAMTLVISMPGAGPCSPHRWASTEKLGSAPRRPPSQERPQPLPRGTACKPCLLQNLKGTCTHPGPCALGLATLWPAFAKPGPGFLCNLGFTPASKAAGTETRDGIKDRLWAQLSSSLEFRATQGLQRQPLWEGQPVTVMASRCHPHPSTRTLQSTLDYGKVTLGPWLYPSLPSGRAGRNWVG